MRLTKWLSRKSSGAGGAISAYKIGQPQWTPRNYKQLSEEAYQKNVIAYKCIKLVSGNFASVDWYVTRNGEEVEDHPIIALLQKPNITQTGSEFFANLASFFLCSGNGYMEAVRTSRGEPKELHTHRPDRMQVIPGMGGVPEGYKYEANGVRKEWPADIITGVSDIKHLKAFHPLDDWYGMSPIEAAAMAVDQHNETSKLNAALLQNGLFLGGLFSWKTGSKENLKAFETSLWQRYQGTRNAAKPMVIGGEIEFINANVSPKDIEFLNGKKLSAAELCLAFGVNPILIFNESVAYNNVLNARRELWEDTIIPLLELVRDALNQWLVPMFREKGLKLEFDVSETPVMQERQKLKEDSARGAWRDGLITKNEAREVMGWDDIGPEGDEYYQGFAGSLSFDSSGDKKPKEGDDPEKGLTFLPKEAKALDAQTSLLIVNELDQPEVVAHTTGLVQEMLRYLVLKFGEDVVEEIGNIAAFQNTIRVQDYIIQHTGDLITQINDTTKNQIRNEVLEWFNGSEKVEKLAERINKVFDCANATRARIIAQTESTGAAGFGALEAMVQSNVEKMEWFTSFQNSRDAHIAMNGQVADVLNGYFHAPGGARTRRPGGFGVASLDINCNCAIGMALTDDEKAVTTAEEYWEKREQKRVATHGAIEKTMKTVFNVQRKAIIDRLSQLGG